MNTNFNPGIQPKSKSTTGDMKATQLRLAQPALQWTHFYNTTRKNDQLIRLVLVLVLTVMALSLSAQNAPTALWKALNGHIYNVNLQSNVGIGTILPNERLTVGGNVRANAFMSNGLIFGSSAPGISYPFDYETIGVSNTNYNLRLQSPKSIFFHTGTGIEAADSTNADRNVRMSILPTSVGIGLTDPEYDLTVSGNVASVDSSGQLRTILGTTEAGDGSVRTYGTNGTPNFIVSNFGPNQGVAGVYDENGNNRASMGITSIGAGYFRARGRNGGSNFFASGDSSGNGYGHFYNNAGNRRISLYLSNIGAGILKTFNSIGNQSFVTATDSKGHGYVYIYNKAGQSRVGMDITSSGAGYFHTFNANGDRSFVVSSNSKGNAYAYLYNKDITPTVRMENLSSRAGYIQTSGPNGKANVTLTTSSGNANRGGISVYNEKADAKISLSILPSGEGYIETVGKNGRDNVRLTTLLEDANKGFVAVIDGRGTTEAGIYVNSDGKGAIFADVKNFRMDHPREAGKEIWYACIEGPEAAAYERGVAELKNGEAFVEFSDHFQLVVNSNTMTVILTPQSAETFGLAVVKKTARGILVKELNGGRRSQGGGNFKFDWEVKGVRKGFEDYKVIRDASDNQPAAIEEDHPVEDAQESNSEPVEQEQELEVTTSRRNLADTGKSNLGQNRPNPFSGRTTIPFSIGEEVESAQLTVYALSGQPIKQISIAERGQGEVTVDISTLPAGNYFYTLVLDGQLLETKQMVLAK